MAQQTINNGETGSVVRSKLNANFTELYAALAPTLPAGLVAPFAMNSPPSGWLKCDGSAVSRTTYSTLFAAIGTTFGVGDGSTTFNLPDLRAEFIRGWDDSRGIDAGRGFGTTQAQATQAHNHQWWSPTGHGGTSAIDMFTTGSGWGTWDSSGNAIGTFSDPLNINAYTDDVLGATSGETRPRNVALLYCIKT